MFYGWKIVWVAFLTHFISVGFIFYSYGVFFKALAADFGGSRFGVAAGLAVMNVVSAFGSPLLGRRLDRGSIRNIMLLGTVLMCVGFLLASQIAALWQFYLVLGTFLATGSMMIGGLAGSTLVANWFVDRRGTALGIATMGISLSGVAMAPAATLLISRIGWRHTFVVYGVLGAIVIAPVVWRWVVNRPEDIGELPDGRDRRNGRSFPSRAVPGAEPVLPLAPGDQITDHAPGLVWSSRGVLRDRNFWVIAVVMGLNFSANSAVLTHIIPHATDLGIPDMRAAFVLSAMAGLGVIGKVAFGWIGDRVSKRIALSLATALQFAGLGLMLGVDAYAPLLVSASVFGLGMGGLVPLWGALVGAGFGRERFGRVMGMMSPVMIPIQVIGVPFAGWVFDTTGSYDAAFRSLLAVYAAAIGVLLFLRLPDVEPGVA